MPPWQERTPDIRMVFRGAYDVMVNLGATMCERGCSVVLVQEPYTSGRRVRELPAGTRTFLDSRGYAAVIVNDANVECVLIDSSDEGVCVSVEGTLGKLFFASVYCKFNEGMERFLKYMERVLLMAGNCPTVIGPDANALSPLWFSKLFGRSSNMAGYSVASGLSREGLEPAPLLAIIHESSEVYTFDASCGRSDIDVTIANEAAARMFCFTWRVEAVVSDHNFIEVAISHDTVGRDTDVVCKGCRLKRLRGSRVRRGYFTTT